MLAKKSTMTLNTPPEEMAKIDAFALQNGMSKTTFVRKAIKTYLYLHPQEVYIKIGDKFTLIKL